MHNYALVPMVISLALVGCNVPEEAEQNASSPETSQENRALKEVEDGDVNVLAGLCQNGYRQGSYCNSSLECGRFCTSGPQVNQYCNSAFDCGKWCSSGPRVNQSCNSDLECLGSTCVSTTCIQATCA